MPKRFFLKIFFLFLILFLPVFKETAVRGSNMSTTSFTVLLAVCGNNLVDFGEECDDGNIVSNDGCSDLCTIELVYCGDSLCNNSEDCATCPADCGGCESCGNGICNFEETCATCPADCGGCSIGGATDTMVVISGLSYPHSKVKLVIDGISSAATFADKLGKFNFRIGKLSSGLYNFGFLAEDRFGNSSIIFNYSVNIAKSTITVVSGIVLPPTLAREKSGNNKLIKIFGQSVAESVVVLNSDILSGKSLNSNGLGDWFFDIDTENFSAGRYFVEAKTKTPDKLESVFSDRLHFDINEKGKIEFPEEEKEDEEEVIACALIADFNCDQKVDAYDLSIMFYWWDAENKKIDLNHNGIVDVYDFSILLYHWTG